MSRMFMHFIVFVCANLHGNLAGSSVFKKLRVDLSKISLILQYLFTTVKNHTRNLLATPRTLDNILKITAFNIYMPRCFYMG